ncbi:MAG: hypothetical protein WC624_03430, partial [Candidatus Margulisiibacteriota bacterium]
MAPPNGIDPNKVPVGSGSRRTNIGDAHGVDNDLAVDMTNLIDSASQSPRDGDYCNLGSGHVGSYSTAVGNIIRNNPGKGDDWIASQIATAFSAEALANLSNGIFMRGRRDYDKAEVAFDSAIGIYGSLMSGNPNGLPGIMGTWIMMRRNPGAIGKLISSNVKKNAKFASQIQMTITNLEILKIRPDRIITDEMAYQRITSTQLAQILDDRLIKKIEGTRANLKDEAAGGKGLMLNTRSFGIEASLLLEVAKRLSIRNVDHAITVTDKAIEICLKQLKNISTNMMPDIIYSFISTLAWAYNAKASYMNKLEPGSGIEFAKKAAAIYAWLIYGPNGDNGLNASKNSDLKGSVQDISDIIDKFGNVMSSLSESVKSLKAGGGYITSGNDMLQRNATNEIELYLNLADALTDARKFSEALGEYDNIISMQPQIQRLQQAHVRNQNEKGFPLRMSFWARAKTNKATAILQKVNREYPTNKDAEVAEKLIDEALRLSQAASNELKSFITGTPQGNCPVNPVPICCSVKNCSSDNEHNLFSYMKAYSTLAWAYASRGSITKEQNGGGKDDLTKALSMYNSIYLQPSDPQTTEFANTSLRGLRTDRRFLMQIETGLTIPEIYQRRAEVSNNLEDYKNAVSAFGKITTDDTDYNSVQLALLEIGIVKAKRIFFESGNSTKVMSKLKEIETQLGAIAARNLNRVQKLRVQMLQAQIWGTMGWQSLQLLKRNTANQYFDKAIQFYRSLFSSPNVEQAYALGEMLITKGNLRLTIAELLKIRFEQDLNSIGQAEAEFSAARDEFNKENNKRGAIQSRLGQIECACYKVKLHMRKDNLKEVAAFLNSSYPNDLMAITKEALDMGALRLASRSAQTLSTLYGVRGGIEEIIHEEGKGQENFLLSADILKAMLGEEALSFTGITRPKLPDDWTQFLKSLRDRSKILSDPQFLLLSDSFSMQVRLNIAELIKSAGAKSIPILEEAQKAYDAVVPPQAADPVSSRLRYFINLAKLQAGIGKAEAKIVIG